VSFPRRRETSLEIVLEERQIGWYLPQHFVSSLRDYQGLDSRLRGNDNRGCGNDNRGCGNDNRGCGNDNRGCGNDSVVTSYKTRQDPITPSLHHPITPSLHHFIPPSPRNSKTPAPQKISLDSRLVIRKLTTSVETGVIAR